MKLNFGPAWRRRFAPLARILRLTLLALLLLAACSQFLSTGA